MVFWQIVSFSLSIVSLSLLWFVFALRAERKKKDVTVIEAGFTLPPVTVIEAGFILPPKNMRILAAINKLTVDELKQQLSHHKLAQQGSKSMLLERLRHCNNIETNGTTDEQAKNMFLWICWGIEVPRLAFVDKNIAAELISQNLEVIEQIRQFGTHGLM